MKIMLYNTRLLLEMLSQKEQITKTGYPIPDSVYKSAHKEIKNFEKNIQNLKLTVLILSISLVLSLAFNIL